MVKGMNTWLRLLPMEIQEVSEQMLPQISIGTNEIVVGALPAELINLYSLWTATAKESERLLVDLRYSQDDESLLARCDELSDKAKALEVLFWIGVKEYFNIWGIGVKETVAIRKEYQIVRFKRADSIPPFMKGLFGLG